MPEVPTMRPTPSQTERNTEGGFTLVEVLVASLIFAIGMIAAIAMQYSALGGYANARDVTQATDVGERVIHLLKQESQQWQTRNAINTMSNSVYKDSSSGPGFFPSDPLLKSLASNSDWTWTPVFTEPVDVRLSDAGNRRYCAYIRGEEIPSPTASGPGQGSGVYRVHVAVVYPGPNQAFGGSGDFGECDRDPVMNNLEPKPWKSPSKSASVSDLESNGYRVVFTGTQVIMRNFLDEDGSYGS